MDLFNLFSFFFHEYITNKPYFMLISIISKDETQHFRMRKEREKTDNRKLTFK